MFTGLIETIGIVTDLRRFSNGAEFTIDCRFDSEPLRAGESIAVDGVCVTVETFSEQGFAFTASAETLQRSNLKKKDIGAKTHLERALRWDGRLGGHFVQGHVDGGGKVLRVVSRGSSVDLQISIPDNLLRYVVEKGSLTVQGVSLTVARLQNNIVTLVLIPATLKTTYLGELKAGEDVNIEVDIIAKYVESMMHQEGGITDEKLSAWGFY